MRNIYVRTPHGLATIVGDVFTGKRDSFGREVFENDMVHVEFITEFGSILEDSGRMMYLPECGGFHFVSDRDQLSEALECDTYQIIRIIDEKITDDKVARI